MELSVDTATLGVLGGGQLGAMFVESAQAMGYRSVVWEPSADSPAGRIADLHIAEPFSEAAAFAHFIDECGAATLEFENIPVSLLQQLEDYKIPLFPAAKALRICQDRIAEKIFVSRCGVATTPFSPIVEAADIKEAFAKLSPPLVLKTARLGYDGKGQHVVTTPQQALRLFNKMKQVPCIAEQQLPLVTEISVVLARSQNGECAMFPVAENFHRNAILHLSRVPAGISDSLQEQACADAQRLAQSLDYHGVLAVEFFVVNGDHGSELLVNEMAPRPHNSGHYTLDACSISQFDAQVATMCGLALGKPQLIHPAIMVNLLGDLWQHGEPRWDVLLRDPQLKLHLYGKQQARRGRKMGHFCLLGDNLDIDMDALQAYAEQYHKLLTKRDSD